MIEAKPLFKERIEILLPEKEDREKFWEVSRSEAPKSIRCNNLKTSSSKLSQLLRKKDWKIEQPFQKNPEIIIIKSNLSPGELGKTTEHLLGYYYVQEVSSIMPLLALNPKANETLLDLCAAPGSKTTQAADLMQNTGTILANDPNLGRVSVLSANLQKIGASNTVITRHDGVQLCKKLKKLNFKFDKILVDAPCSGEGNIRSNPKTHIMWNLKAIQKLSRIQKKLAQSALEILKPGGEMVYSTCTHSPEENEIVVQHLLDNHNIELQEINIPLKTRPGVTEWRGEKLKKELKKCHRIWPQDNNTEGFFLCKLKKK